MSVGTECVFEVGDTFAEERVHGEVCDFHERREDERALVHPRMRDGKFRRFVYLVANEEDIDIDDARLIVNMFPESLFDRFHVVEELVGTELGLRFDGHVVKIWLFTYSLRLRDINRTAFCDVDVRGEFFERCAHVGDAVAEVGPESEVYRLHKGHGSAARRLLLESGKHQRGRRRAMHDTTADLSEARTVPDNTSLTAIFAETDADTAPGILARRVADFIEHSGDRRDTETALLLLQGHAFEAGREMR